MTYDVILLATDILRELCIPAHLKGYNYLRDAVVMTVERPDIIRAVTKELYPAVAVKNKTTPERVERAIRHASLICWQRCDEKVKTLYFGEEADKRPANSRLIRIISRKISASGL